MKNLTNLPKKFSHPGDYFLDFLAIKPTVCLREDKSTIRPPAKSWCSSNNCSSIPLLKVLLLFFFDILTSHELQINKKYFFLSKKEQKKLILLLHRLRNWVNDQG